MAFLRITDPEEITEYYTAKIMYYSVANDGHTCKWPCTHQLAISDVADSELMERFGWRLYVFSED